MFSVFTQNQTISKESNEQTNKDTEMEMLNENQNPYESTNEDFI